MGRWSLAIIGKFHCVGLGEKLRKGIQIHGVFADMEHTMTQSTHGADNVEWTICVFMCGGKEKQAEALAASKRNQVASLCLLRGRKKAGHFDRNKEGGRASDANGLDCVRFGAV